MGSHAPTQVVVQAALETARDNLRKSKRPEDRAQAAYLRMILAGESIPDDRVFFEASVAVALSAPIGTTDDQLLQVLLAAGRHAAQPGAVTNARKGAEFVREQRRQRASSTRDNPSLDEFKKITVGQKIGQIDHGSEHNVRVALNKLGAQVQYNAFSEEEELVYNDERVVIDDNHLKCLRNAMEREHGFKPSKDDLWDTVSVIARENAYHPIVEYLDDVDARLANAHDDLSDLPSTWLIRFAGVEDTPYVRAVSQLMLVAAVRRVRQPGCVFQEMMILESPEQGKSKSTALRVLAVRPEWFTDDFTFHGDSKKMIEQTNGRWIIEAGELRGMSQGDHNAFKQYLSRTHDRARMSYDRKTRWVARQFVQFGSTNDEQYFKDSTGNRRYWPIRIREFDVEALAAMRDRLWAEASRLERENPQPEFIRLDPSLYEAAADEQSKREVLSSYFVKLEEALDGAVGTIVVQDVWKLLGFEDNNQPNKPQMMEIASVMSQLKFKAERSTIGGRRKRYYVRGTGPERDIPLKVLLVNGTYRVKASPLTIPAATSPPVPALAQGN